MSLACQKTPRVTPSSFHRARLSQALVKNKRRFGSYCGRILCSKDKLGPHSLTYLGGGDFQVKFWNILSPSASVCPQTLPRRLLVARGFWARTEESTNSQQGTTALIQGKELAGGLSVKRCHQVKVPPVDTSFLLEVLATPHPCAVSIPPSARAGHTLSCLTLAEFHRVLVGLGDVCA